MRTTTSAASTARVAAPELVHGTYPFDVAESTFRLLCTGPSPLAVDGRRIGHGLPARPIGLTELASMLMHPVTPYPARDAAWRLLITRARTAGPGWVVGAVGVALPALRVSAARLSRTFTGDAQAEILAGFLVALDGCDLDAPRVCSRLCNTAHVTARARLRTTEPATSGEVTFQPTSTVPAPLFGHPDFVLARAVKAGVITADEAELIGVTRLEEVTLAEYADRIGAPRWRLYKTRTRAEERLATALRAGALSDEDAQVIAEATMTLLPDLDYRH